MANRRPASVTLEREGGKVVSAYVELRRGVKAVGTVKPNASALVFLLIAQDGFPIGIRLFEPVGGVVVCEIIDRLVEGPSGPAGIDRQTRHHFMSDRDEFRRFVSGFRDGIQKLGEAVAAESR